MRFYGSKNGVSHSIITRRRDEQVYFCLFLEPTLNHLSVGETTLSCVPLVVYFSHIITRSTSRSLVVRIGEVCKFVELKYNGIIRDKFIIDYTV